MERLNRGLVGTLLAIACGKAFRMNDRDFGPKHGRLPPRRPLVDGTRSGYRQGFSCRRSGPFTSTAPQPAAARAGRSYR